MRSQPLVKLAWAIDCSSLEQTFGAVYEDQRVGLLMAGPATLKQYLRPPRGGVVRVKLEGDEGANLCAPLTNRRNAQVCWPAAGKEFNARRHATT